MLNAPLPQRQSRSDTYPVNMYLAGVYGVDLVKYGPKDIRNTFDSLGVRTKHERAKMASSMLPALSHRLPPKRKAWSSEDPRMSPFEAAALGLTYFSQKQRD